MLNEKLIDAIAEREQSDDPDHGRGYVSVARLIELGRKQGYVTIDDILNIIPEAERDVDKLEEAFAALLGAGIAYVDDPDMVEPTDKELVGDDEGEEDKSSKSKAEDDNYLANIDTDDMIGLYLKEVGRVPLLTAEEEVSLAKRIEQGRFSRESLATGDFADSERDDHRFNIEDGWAAREHLITANSRLVISVAKKYMGRGVPFQDLIQEGNIGLIRAAKKFDYKRGHKFKIGRAHV